MNEQELNSIQLEIPPPEFYQILQEEESEDEKRTESYVDHNILTDILDS